MFVSEMFNKKKKAIKEGASERTQNALWAQITDYEKRAKETSNDIKKQHYLKMADELRGKLQTSDNVEEGNLKNKLAAAALAGGMAAGANGAAVSVAGAIPTPSHQAAMYKAAADSNAAEARRQAELQKKADAERLQKNTEIVDKEQRVNHHLIPKNEAREWDEGNTEPANNFAVYINGKKWKVFPAGNWYADSLQERQRLKALQAWAAKKSASSGKKWTVQLTGEQATPESIEEASPETSLNLLKGLKTYQVVIMNNYYRGKYSDYSGRYYYVLASSPEQARQVVLDNADGILQDLLTLKGHNGKKILPRGSAIRITPERIGDIKDGTEAGRMSTAGFKKMFGPEGVMSVKLSGGAIVDVEGQGVEETKVSKYKDLGATKDTTHFIKNVTTGEIMSPHRSKADAEDALVGYYRGPSDGNEYKIVRARKEGVEEGAELKKAKRNYNQAAKDANQDQVGAGKKIDTMKKSLRQKDLGKGVTESQPEDANFVKWMRQNYPDAAKSAETYANAKKHYAQHLRQKYKDHPAYKEGVAEAENPYQQRILDSDPEALEEFLTTGYLDTTSDLYNQMYDYYANQMPTSYRNNMDKQYDFITSKIREITKHGVAEDHKAGTNGFRVTWTEAGQKCTSGLLLKPHAIEHAKMLQKKQGTSDVKVVPYNTHNAVKEGNADQQRKIVKKNGKPVGEIGIDGEASPGNGNWYMKHYASGTDLSGYDSFEDALGDLKHCISQGLDEGRRDEDNPFSKGSMGDALWKALKTKKASPAQQQRNKERWAKRDAERQQNQDVTEERGGSKFGQQVQDLLKQGAKVDSYILGARGHITRADGGGLYMKRLNKPYSKMNFVLPIGANRDADLYLKQVSDNHYHIKSKKDDAWLASESKASETDVDKYMMEMRHAGYLK